MVDPLAVALEPELELPRDPDPQIAVMFHRHVTVI